MPDFVIMGRDPKTTAKLAEALSKKTGLPFTTEPGHRAEPMDGPLGELVCRVCGGAVRQWPDGRFPIHART